MKPMYKKVKIKVNGYDYGELNIFPTETESEFMERISRLKKYLEADKDIGNIFETPKVLIIFF